MNDFNLVAMFLFSALEGQVAENESIEFDIDFAIHPEDIQNLPPSIYERCGMGAYEVAQNLSPMAQEMLGKFNPEHPFTDLLYTDCDIVAAALYTFMREHQFMPTSLYSLELSKCLTLK